MNATHVYGADSLSPPWTPDWRTHGACLSVDPELFFPPDGDSYGIKAAKQVCRRCAVRDECEAWTFDHPKLSQHGIWAGLTPRQRKDRRRKAVKA